MVRKVIAIAALPLINALYIPHDFKGVNEIVHGSPESVPSADSVAETYDEEDTEELTTYEKPRVHDSIRVTIESPIDNEEDDDWSPEEHDEDAESEAKFLASLERAGKENKLRKAHSKNHPGKHGKKHHNVNNKMNKILDSLIVSTASPEDVIPDKYIVVFDDSMTSSDLKSHMSWLADVTDFHAGNYLAADIQHPLLETGMGVDKIFDLTSFLGYAGAFLPEVAEAIANAPGVKFVERDSIVHALNKDVESSAPWGLARVSHRKPLSLGTFNKYAYDDEGGEGVTAYIVDTGVYIDHEDFEGRAKWGKTIPIGDTDRDAHGHGSHCAGTIGGKKYGVAKKANLVAVKVLGSDGSGSMSDVIGGVEYVVQSHRAEQKKNPKLKGSTANMSLGGGKSPSLDLAINAAVNAGVHFAVAAGNENQDACNVSPAGATGPVTVGATTLNDERAYFSNYGKCVDIFAPGVNVQSVGIESPSSSAIMSGTSMASPHIAGLLTYFLSLQPSTDSQYATRGAITPKQLKADLISFGTPNLIEDLDAESPNVLAYNGGGKDIGDLWGAGSSRRPAPSGSESFVGEIESGFLHELAEIAEKATEFVSELSHSSEQLF